jgi:hypothetical protein
MTHKPTNPQTRQTHINLQNLCRPVGPTIPVTHSCTNPYPSVRVWYFTGMGKGHLKIPLGYPCQTLFMPLLPHPTPEKGIKAIPIASMGSNPGSPIALMPEYDYDRTSPLSPPAPKSNPLSSSSSSSSTKSSQDSYFPACTQKLCLEGCFDITYM